MKRFLAAALVAFLGLSLMASDALAYKRHWGWRHPRRHHARFRHYYGWWYYPHRLHYGPRVIVYKRRILYPHVVVVPAPWPVYYPYLGFTREFTGAILGGIAGGVIGAQIGKGTGRTAAIIGGSIIGALLGADVGRQLDERDLLLLHTRTQYALEKVPSGYVVGWRSPYTGVNGTIIPRPAYQIAPGRYCREFQQTVTIGGRTERAYGTACRRPDGSWRIGP
ncbi:MAG: RT0821/Lpp0805 family surface protein [Nitrospinota bacterium]